MTDDYDFISSVKALAGNGTLAELLHRLEEDSILTWRSAPTYLIREECWHALKAIQALKEKIQSFGNDEKVRAWANQKLSRRI